MNIQTCRYCGRHEDTSAVACGECGTPFVPEAPTTPMSPGMFRDLIAAVAGAICVSGYLTWASGQYRYNHWLEGIVWGLGVAIGLASAFMGLRLAKNVKQALLAAGLLCFHFLSLLFLMLMISFIGVRP